MQRLQYIDSHTAGEPTRVVVEGSPDLGSGDMVERLARLRSEHDWLRRGVILEPRGSAWLVGALLQPPVDPSAALGVIFFNNTGYLGMCGHGLIGVIETLNHMGRIQPGVHQVETPAGRVEVRLNEDRSVAITNVLSYRYRRQVKVEVPSEGEVVGDIAYGGNWFFLVSGEQVEASNLNRLLMRSRRIQAALLEQGIRGQDGGEIDHIELFGAPSAGTNANSRNFVLCPGGEYDRSPCGTGTSAKLACLAADEAWPEDRIWRQESIVGSVFEGCYRRVAGGVMPTITGRAYVTGETTCCMDPLDPFRTGIDLSSVV